MITDDDIDAIMNIWWEEWRGPLAEPLPKGQNVEEPLLHQVNGEEHEGDNNQDDPSQEHNEDDDNIDDSDHHAFERPPSQ